MSNSKTTFVTVNLKNGISNNATARIQKQLLLLLITSLNWYPVYRLQIQKQLLLLLIIYKAHSYIEFLNIQKQLLLLLIK